MSILKYTREHISSLLELISKLKQSEFPYYSSFLALEKIEERFKTHLLNLEDLEFVNEATLTLCRQIMAEVCNVLPILGFILRSTNVRNAFEMYSPLLRLVRTILGDDKKIILSSEWEYSPYTYRLLPFKELSEYILIGFPASESDNPLLFPLSGHEIGHHVWRVMDDSNNLIKFRQEIENTIINLIYKKQRDFISLFPNINCDIFKHEFDVFKNEVRQDTSIDSIITNICLITLKQLEEIFCDFFGLYLFKESFIFAFVYSLSPGIMVTRNIGYPDIYDRIKYLEFAAKKMGIYISEDFKSYFERQEYPSDPYNKLYLELADEITKKFISNLIDLVIEYTKNKRLPEYKHENVEEIFDLFKNKLSPIIKPYSLIEILNAGWKCYLEINSWKNRFINHWNFKKRREILKELILKSIEILEIYTRLKEKNDS